MCDFFDEKEKCFAFLLFVVLEGLIFFLILARCGIFVQRVATWRMEYGEN